MSNLYLPQETLESIIDLLYDKPETLRECCLVSKSWVPRTRKHLFADIRFHSAGDLDSWKKTFPDPSHSPAYHTHTLTISCTEAITTEDAEPGGWIPTFSRVLRLQLNNQTEFGNLMLGVTLAPFHKFSPVLKSLRVDSAILSCSQTFNLVRSFPLLEEVGHNGWEGDGNDLHEQRTVVTSTSGPVFTGTLELLLGGFGSTARRLLDLPGGLRFRKLVLLWHCVRDFRWIMELVVKCSDTLESLNIMCHPLRKFVLVLLWSYDLPSFTGDLSHASIDLLKATKLKDVIFRPGSPTITWIVMTLQSIPSKHRDLQQISISVPHDFALINVGANIGQIIGEAVYREWLDLDRLLAQFWESRSIRPKLIRTAQEKRKRNMRYCIGCLLPEITKSGIIDLV